MPFTFRSMNQSNISLVAMTVRISFLFYLFNLLLHSFIALNVYASAIGGALASCAHDAVMTPLDVVKQRVQLGMYAKPRVALRSIISTEGIHALYTSYFTTLLMNVPNATILVVVNDWLKSILNPTGKQVTIYNHY